MARRIFRIIAQDTQSPPVFIHAEKSPFRNDKIINRIMNTVKAGITIDIVGTKIKILINVTYI